MELRESHSIARFGNAPGVESIATAVKHGQGTVKMVPEREGVFVRNTSSIDCYHVPVHVPRSLEFLYISTRASSII